MRLSLANKNTHTNTHKLKIALLNIVFNPCLLVFLSNPDLLSWQVVRFMIYMITSSSTRMGGLEAK